jgi:hypothetical protein
MESSIPLARRIPKNTWDLEIIHQIFDPQAVPAFGIQSVDEPHAQNGHQRRALADSGKPFLENIAHVLPSIAVLGFGRLEAVLWHEQRQHNGNRRDQHTACHDRQAHSDIAERNGSQHTDESPGQIVAVGVQESPVGVLFADFVRKPGLCSTRSKGVSHSPQHLRQNNGHKSRERAFHDEGPAHDEIAQNNRQPP